MYGDEIPCGSRCRGCSYCSDAYGYDAMRDAAMEDGIDRDAPYYASAAWSAAKAKGYTRVTNDPAPPPAPSATNVVERLGDVPEEEQ